jgi:hypothetical protein
MVLTAWQLRRVALLDAALCTPSLAAAALVACQACIAQLKL